MCGSNEFSTSYPRQKQRRQRCIESSYLGTTHKHATTLEDVLKTNGENASLYMRTSIDIQTACTAFYSDTQCKFLINSNRPTIQALNSFVFCIYPKLKEKG